MLSEQVYALDLTLLGMGTVFFCLALLYVFFAGAGRASTRYRQRRAGQEPAPAAAPEAGEEAEVPEAVVASIALALAQARPAAPAGAMVGAAAEVRLSAAGLTWREQGRLLQHQRSRDWERK